MSLKNLAIIGASGFIGRNLLRALSSLNNQIVGTSSKSVEGLLEFDLRDPDIAQLLNSAPHLSTVIIAAGITGIAACEQNPSETHRVNVDGILSVAQQCARKNIKTVVFSSDYVFDGALGCYTETSPTNPLNEYGKQRAEIEKKLPQICDKNYLIVRLSKLYDVQKSSQTLLTEIVQCLSNGKTIDAAYDQFFCPTYVEDIVNILITLTTHHFNGLINVCAPEILTRYDVAKNVALRLGYDIHLIHPIQLSDLHEPFSRPKNTSMVCIKLNNLYTYDFATLNQCIDKIVLHYYNNL